jgi:hypothetical protein
MTTGRAITIITLAVLTGWVCVVDLVPDVAGVLVLLVLGAWAYAMPHADARQSR